MLTYFMFVDALLRSRVFAKYRTRATHSLILINFFHTDSLYSSHSQSATECVSVHSLSADTGILPYKYRIVPPTDSVTGANWAANAPAGKQTPKPRGLHRVCVFTNVFSFCCVGVLVCCLPPTGAAVTGAIEARARKQPPNARGLRFTHCVCLAAADSSLFSSNTHTHTQVASLHPFGRYLRNHIVAAHGPRVLMYEVRVCVIVCVL